MLQVGEQCYLRALHEVFAYIDKPYQGGGENYLIGYVRMLSVGHPAVSNESLYIQGDMPKYDNRPIECTYSDIQGTFKTLIFVNKDNDEVNIKDLIL